jgi:hypothetical protein
MLRQRANHSKINVFTPKCESLIIFGLSRIGGKLKKIIAVHNLED